MQKQIPERLRRYLREKDLREKDLGEKDLGEKEAQELRWKRLFLFVGGAMTFVIVVILVVAAISRFSDRIADIKKAALAEARVTQIYPNYTFAEGVEQIRVPLISDNQQLSREAGGWVITPDSSEFRSDYEVPIVIEYIDGRKFHREPRKPAWDGVRPANSIFRLYGKEGEYATVTIKRGVY